MRPPREVVIKTLKAGAFLLSLLPVGLLVWKGLHEQLGANPVDVITRATGKWTLVFLLVTLSITPLRKIAGMPWLVRFRRPLGLFAFFYGTLHLTTYVWLDKFFDIHEMLHDILKRKFITAGMTAFTLMLPLAVTSTTGWIRRLGGKRWQALHRLIYVSAAAGVIHFVWLVKADLRRPLTYGAALTALLAYRVTVWIMGKSKPRLATAAARPV